MNRATFHSRYTFTDAQRDPKTKGPRLLDYITNIVGIGEAFSLFEPDAGEFCVVDLKEGEKAYITMPYGSGPALHKQMIESLFMAPARRVADKLWIV